jgi:hypothetical protein
LNDRRGVVRPSQNGFDELEELVAEDRAVAELEVAPTFLGDDAEAPPHQDRAVDELVRRREPSIECGPRGHGLLPSILAGAPCLAVGCCAVDEPGLSGALERSKVGYACAVTSPRSGGAGDYQNLGTYVRV